MHLERVSPIDPQAKAAALAALLPGFVKHRLEDARDLRKALEAGDLEFIARIAHKIRGNGASFGFPELSELGARLETAAKTSARDAIRVELDALDRRLVDLSKEIPIDEPAP